MTSMSNKSPLRYPGGKTRACAILYEITTSYFDMDHIDTIASPFFGGGSFEFFMESKYHKPLRVNDKFKPLYHFWRQVKENKGALCHDLTNITQVSKPDFMNHRELLQDESTSVLQQAVSYFIVNRCSFSGASLSGGFSEVSSSSPLSVGSARAADAIPPRQHVAWARWTDSRFPMPNSAKPASTPIWGYASPWAVSSPSHPGSRRNFGNRPGNGLPPCAPPGT